MKINTSAIGDEFELNSLDIIKQLIKEEQISHPGKYLKIQTKKKYPSPLRKKGIQFDITIEVWPPGATRYSLLYVIECKKYKNKVPVSRIETFHSQLVQLGSFNIKGIFISNVPLQEGGFNIVQSAGIMVIRGESKDNYKIILHKDIQGSRLTKIPFFQNNFNQNKYDRISEILEERIDKRILAAFNKIVSKVNPIVNTEKLSKNDIKRIAEGELNKVNPKILSEGHVLTPEKLTAYLENNLDIKITTIHNTAHVLGLCNLEKRIIGLNSLIRGTNRELFILAHEFGHFILHHNLKIDQVAYNLFEDSSFNFSTNRHDLKNPKNWIEWQANYFATSIILPEKPFKARLHWCQQRLGFKKGIIYLDDQYHNQKDFGRLTKQMAYVLSTSQTSIIYRLQELNLIDNQSRLKTLSQIVEENNIVSFI